MSSRVCASLSVEELQCNAGYNLSLHITGNGETKPRELVFCAAPPLDGLGDVHGVSEQIDELKRIFGLDSKKNLLDLFSIEDLPEIDYHDDLPGFALALHRVKPYVADDQLETIGRTPVDETLRAKLQKAYSLVEHLHIERFQVVSGYQRKDNELLRTTSSLAQRASIERTFVYSKPA